MIEITNKEKEMNVVGLFKIASILFSAVLLSVMADKVYEPEVVQENPFPTDTSEEIGSSNDGVSGDNYSNTQTRQTTTPKKRVSTELLSTALNTRSRKVLQEFELTQSGGFQVGDFKEGISGDLRITPNGLTARDQAGVTTFAIDGTTGSAVFVGEVRSGSLISGSLITGDVEVDSGGNLLLQEGADISLRSTSGDQSKILFYDTGQFNDDSLAVEGYIDSNSFLHVNPTSNDRASLFLGGTANKYTVIEAHAIDGVKLRAESNGGTEFYLYVQPSKIDFYYEGSPVARLESDGTLRIIGTIQENWVP